MHNNIHMLAYILYFTLESKMIIVGPHIITLRHVFNIHISTSKVCILLGASQQIRYGKTPVIVLHRYCLIVVVNAMLTKHNLIIYYTSYIRYTF